jgi:hypothetical protein
MPVREAAFTRLGKQGVPVVPPKCTRARLSKVGPHRLFIAATHVEHDVVHSAWGHAAGNKKKFILSSDCLI